MLKKIFFWVILTHFSLPVRTMEPHVFDEALCKAIHLQDLQTVTCLLQEGANPNAYIHAHPEAHAINNINNEKVSPLEFLTRHKDCNHQLCKLLLEHGANPEDKANVHLIVNVTRYVPLDKQFELYNLLFEYGAKLPEVFPSRYMHPIIEYRPFVRIVKFYGFETDALKHLVTSPLFNPKLHPCYFFSCKRIITTLLSLKKCCPQMPKDLCMHLVKEYLTEDFQIMCLYGKLSSINEENAHSVPMKIVRMLIERGQLNADKTVSALKKNHITCIKPYLEEALFVYQEELTMLAPPILPSFEVRKQILKPDSVEKQFGQLIEENIRRRLGLSQHALPSKKVYDKTTCPACAIQ